MNNHMSLCDHMILFVAKSSPEWTQVLRRVTDRLTVHRLVNINHDRPRTSSTAATRKPQHHRLRSQEVNPRAFSSSSKRMVSSEPSSKRGREELSLPPPTEPENVPLPPPIEPEEVLRPPPDEVPPSTPAEVKPPPPEEVKPPRRKVERQPVVQVHVPSINVLDASWSVQMLHQAFVSLGKVVVHLRVQPPTHLLQTTVMDYAFKFNVLARELERGVLPPSMTTTTMAASTSLAPASAPAPAPTPTVGLLRWRLAMFN
jgi:hypothetical protein